MAAESSLLGGERAVRPCGVGRGFETTTHPVWLRDRCRCASHPSEEVIFLGG